MSDASHADNRADIWTMETTDPEGHVWTHKFTAEDGYDGNTDVSEICKEAEYEFDRGAREVTIRRA